MNEIHNRYVASVQAPNTHPGYGGWKPCMDWCEERWGNHGGWWYIGEGVFEFINEQDYLIFLLRWGS